MWSVLLQIYHLFSDGDTGYTHPPHWYLPYIHIPILHWADDLWSLPHLYVAEDIPAVQKVFDSKVELVVIPCRNVASNLSTTIYELQHYLNKDTKLNKYLCDIFVKCKKSFTKKPKDEIGSSKTLWDLSAIAYEINSDWFKSEVISCPVVLDNGLYKETR